MKQSMDGVGSSREAVRLAPGEIARLREHAEASGRPVTSLIESRRPAADRPATAPAAPTVSTTSTAAPMNQPATPTAKNKLHHWKTIGSTAAGILGLAVLVAGVVAGQSIDRAEAQRKSITKIETTTPRATPMPVLDTALAAQEELQGIVSTFAADQKGRFYVYVKDLKTGAVAGVSADDQVRSASLYKLFVAQRIYALVDQNRLSLSQNATNTKYDVDTCMSRMISISDNDCGMSFGSTLSWGNQNTWLHDQGYDHTSLGQPQLTSARDVGLLLERLYHNQLNSSESNQSLLKYMKAQVNHTRLRAGLPEDTVVADKTGTLDDYVHNSGIVYGPKTDYIISVMTSDWSTPADAPAEIAKLSKQVWDYLEN